MHSIGITSEILSEGIILIIDKNYSVAKEPPNGLRYLRWGGDGEAVQPEKG
jgi:hypothetical protein